MIPLYCILDRKQIPEGRARKGAITCSDECKRQYANYRQDSRTGKVSPLW
jgi:hypothetical protein